MKLKKTISINDIMKLDPCCDRDEIQKLWDYHKMPKRATVLQVAESGYPKIDDILWLLLRPEYIPERELHLFGCWCAERALRAERKAGREPHFDSWNAIRIKRLWLDGKATDAELSKAWSEARSAESAAWSEARSAWSAAWSAVWSARSAAWSAESAAWSAAQSAESAARSAQLKQLIKIIRGLK